MTSSFTGGIGERIKKRKYRQKSPITSTPTPTLQETKSPITRRKKQSRKKTSYEIDKIIGLAESPIGLFYLVKWKGFPESKSSWVHHSFFIKDLGVEEGERVLEEADMEFELYRSSGIKYIDLRKDPKTYDDFKKELKISLWDPWKETFRTDLPSLPSELPLSAEIEEEIHSRVSKRPKRFLSQESQESKQEKKYYS